MPAWIADKCLWPERHKPCRSPPRNPKIEDKLTTEILVIYRCRRLEDKKSPAQGENETRANSEKHTFLRHFGGPNDTIWLVDRISVEKAAGCPRDAPRIHVRPHVESSPTATALENTCRLGSAHHGSQTRHVAQGSNIRRLGRRLVHHAARDCDACCAVRRNARTRRGAMVRRRAN